MMSGEGAPLWEGIMAYCILADIKEQLAEEELVQLTDDVGAEVVDTVVIARAVADADAEIDSYCGGRYSVPFSPVPVMIRKISVDLAIYNLSARRTYLKMPEDRQKRYENAVKFLRDVSKGLISLGAGAPDTTASDSPEVTVVRADRIFTRGRSSDGSAGTLDTY